MMIKRLQNKTPWRTLDHTVKIFFQDSDYIYLSVTKVTIFTFL